MDCRCCKSNSVVLFTLLSLFLPPSHNDNHLGIRGSFPLSVAERLLQERHLLVISPMVSGASASSEPAAIGSHSQGSFLLMPVVKMLKSATWDTSVGNAHVTNPACSALLGQTTANQDSGLNSRNVTTNWILLVCFLFLEHLVIPPNHKGHKFPFKFK